MTKSIKDLRTYLVTVFKSYSEYLGVEVNSIKPSSDKLQPLTAPFINVSVQRLSEGEYTDNSIHQAMVICIFQTKPNANDLINRDNLFDLFEKLEKIIKQKTPEIDKALDIEFQFPITDTGVVYGALSFRTDYKPNPPEFV